ncbi:major facilitator superfamily domain-containing protein [Infundibulicybe gibba]|nr:major facilitator superfamily domain-containing protein [Infundibulicybe gibba]
MSEVSPLLQSDSPGPPEYAAIDRIARGETDGRFSKSRRRAILAMVVWCGFIPSFVSATFALSIPKILDEWPSAYVFDFRLSLLAVCLGGLTGASYSTVHGRRIIYLSGLGLLCLTSIGATRSVSIPQLIVWHFFQSLGAAPILAVGAGVVGDLYKLEERGRAIGIYVGVSDLFGATVVSFVAGLVAPRLSWRTAQLILAAVSFLTFAMMFSLFPETTQPRTGETSQPPTWRRFFVNPLRPLSLLRSPSLLAVSVAGMAILSSGQVLFFLMIFEFPPDPTIHRVFVLSAGIGYLVGALLAGRASDKIIIKRKQHQDGVWYPEDRLRASLSKAMFSVPPLVLILGLTSQFPGRKGGIILILLCLFVNGVGIGIIRGPSVTYAVDVVHSRSAEAVAAVDGLRFLVMLLLSFVNISTSGRITSIAVTLSALFALLALG